MRHSTEKAVDRCACGYDETLMVPDFYTIFLSQVSLIRSDLFTLGTMYLAGISKADDSFSPEGPALRLRRRLVISMSQIPSLHRKHGPELTPSADTARELTSEASSTSQRLHSASGAETASHDRAKRVVPARQILLGSRLHFALVPSPSSVIFSPSPATKAVATRVCSSLRLMQIHAWRLPDTVGASALRERSGLISQDEA
ncbi:hypothetical protein KC326_g60 [Hortaea werneckii]|nr:hypothetical protein KC326_g60 [Hortaea werneckii]